ncbi:MAG TPA: Rrf2 family transcriptional regulator [Candidatus Binatia bacterium]|jgi:Rrf2 family protein|nr:Rrf2 family transcriptional regulator [Candidatus Binatia bacterium]
MKLSKKSMYALRALTCLGSPDTPPLISIQEIAQRENIPKKFLEQVLLALNKAGLVQSNRGKAGGYALRSAPAGITLGDIVRAVDGPLSPLPCANPIAPVKCADCASLERCWLRELMTEVGEAVNTALDQITLVDICRRAAQSKRSQSMQALMYEI